MKHTGLLFALLILAATFAYSLTTNQVDNVNLGTDSTFFSAQFTLSRDSGYTFLWSVRGNADAILFYQTYHMGAYSDTGRLDSVSTNTSYLKLCTKINGDSLMNRWYPTIDSSNFARLYDKTSTPSDWKIRVGIKLKRKATSPGAFPGSGVGKVATVN